MQKMYKNNLDKVLKSVLFIKSERFVMKADSKSSVLNVSRFRLIYVESGAASYVFNNSELKVKSGDILMLAPGIRQVNIYPGAPLIINNIAFNFTEDCCFMGNKAIKNKLRPYNLLKELILEVVLGSSSNSEEYLRLALKLYSEALRNEMSDDCSLKYQIDNYIDDHIHENLTITHLAECFSLSEGYFRRIFKRLFGDSPKHVIKNKRLNCAIRLMKSRDLRMKEVAFSTGYGSEQDFCRQFKQLTGLTPREYKRQFLNQE